MIFVGHNIEPVPFKSRRLFAPFYVGYLAGIGRLLLSGLACIHRAIVIAGVMSAVIQLVTGQGHHWNKAIATTTSADWPA